ncbi:MAG TPA: hypothetical protein VM103_01960 [Candidatus Paceibacterota bacterium]|nr:hypothetical protein [Candidatus Paceibacterota bacterium]
MRFPRITSGFTLVELLLYVSIASFLLIAVSVFLSTLLSARVKNETVMEVEQQGSFVMDVMTQTIRNATAISTPATSTAAVSLSLRTGVASTTPTVFDLATSTLRVTEGVGSSVAFTSADIVASDLLFSNLSGSSTPGTIRIQFTLTAINSSGRNEYDYRRTFYGSATLRP